MLEHLNVALPVFAATSGGTRVVELEVYRNPCGTFTDRFVLVHEYVPRHDEQVGASRWCADATITRRADVDCDTTFQAINACEGVRRDHEVEASTTFIGA